MSSQGEPRAKVKRGVWVYLIAAWYIFSALSSIIGTVAILASAPDEWPPELRGQIAAIDPFDLATASAIYLALLVGSVTLLMMKRVAFYAFLGALLINAVPLLRNIAMRGYVVAGGAPGIAGYAVGITMLIGVLVYVRHLDKSGRLS